MSWDPVAVGGVRRPAALRAGLPSPVLRPCPRPGRRTGRPAAARHAHPGMLWMSGPSPEVPACWVPLAAAVAGVAPEARGPRRTRRRPTHPRDQGGGGGDSHHPAGPVPLPRRRGRRRRTAWAGGTGSASVVHGSSEVWVLSETRQRRVPEEFPVNAVCARHVGAEELPEEPWQRRAAVPIRAAGEGCGRVPVPARRSATSVGFGLWRSLVAHLTGGQGVAGSNPVSPTVRGPDLFRQVRALFGAP